MLVEASPVCVVISNCYANEKRRVGESVAGRPSGASQVFGGSRSLGLWDYAIHLHYRNVLLDVVDAQLPDKSALVVVCFLAVAVGIDRRLEENISLRFDPFSTGNIWRRLAAKSLMYGDVIWPSVPLGTRPTVSKTRLNCHLYSAIISYWFVLSNRSHYPAIQNVRPKLRLRLKTTTTTAQEFVVTKGRRRISMLYNLILRIFRQLE